MKVLVKFEKEFWTDDEDEIREWIQEHILNRWNISLDIEDLEEPEDD